MKKSVQKKVSAKKTSDTRAGRRTPPKDAKSQSTEASVASANDGRLNFNHAMVYVKDVERGLGFYRDLLGFKLVEDFRFENKLVYVRLRAPCGDGMIATRRVQMIPFQATVCACTSKSENWTSSAASFNKTTSTSQNCHT